MEEEEEENFMLPVFDLQTRKEERRREIGNDCGPLSPDVIEIEPSPPMEGTQISNPPKEGARISNPPKSAPFRPPFSSTSSSLSRPQSVRPQSSDATSDNAAEFQGPYPHTQEMMKIFTQVHIHTLLAHALAY